MRLLIIGYPKCGKTTKAREAWESTAVSGQPTVDLHSTDSMIKDYEWSAFSDKVCDMLKHPDPWIIEGCSAVRGLRKYLREGNVPDFTIQWLDVPYVELTPKQAIYGKGCRTVWNECKLLMKENGNG